MPIPITCAACGTQLSAPDDAVGKTASCPNCGQQLVVPEPLFDAEDFDDIPAQGDPPAVPDRASERRPCRACGEMIIASAAKCRFCGEVFDPALKRRQVAGSDADLSGAEWFVAILCSGIGCICGIVWMIQGKPKGTKMFLVSLASSLIWTAIRFALNTAAVQQ